LSLADVGLGQDRSLDFSTLDKGKCHGGNDNTHPVPPATGGCHPCAGQAIAQIHEAIEHHAQQPA